MINVTDFFRDAPTWDYLATEIVPRLLAQKRPQDPIRIWVAGCSSCEEAYTITIVLVEALGEQAFGERVKIYATDADAEALNQAPPGEQGGYTRGYSLDGRARAGSLRACPSVSVPRSP